MTKITKKLADSSTLPEGKSENCVWDSELRGFGLRVRLSGRKSFILKYRNQYGQQRKHTLGYYGAITCEEARKLAQRRLLEISQGADPASETREARSAPTVADLAQRFMEEHAKVKKKPLSIKSDEALLRLHILPMMAQRKVASVTRQDIIKLHQAMHKYPGAANRAITLLSKMLNLAEDWGYREDNSNPCTHIERYKERKLERYLSNAEIRKLLDCLEELQRDGIENADTLLAIRLLLMTGCRRNEVLTLKWSNVDLENRILKLTDSKTGKRYVHLSPQAVQLLLVHFETCGLDTNPYVIKGAKPGAHLVNLQKPWTRIRKICGLQDVRLHDLRHTFASLGAASGLSLPMIGALLGHSQPQTTQRYAHLCNDTLVTATNQIGAAFLANDKIH